MEIWHLGFLGSRGEEGGDLTSKKADGTIHEDRTNGENSEYTDVQPLTVPIAPLVFEAPHSQSTLLSGRHPPRSRLSPLA